MAAVRSARGWGRVPEPELTADEPGDYLLSHTPDGLVVLMRRDGDDVEVVGVVVQPMALPRTPRNMNSPQGRMQNKTISVTTTTIVDSAVLPTTLPGSYEGC